jgi:hypothetical protein
MAQYRTIILAITNLIFAVSSPIPKEVVSQTLSPQPYIQDSPVLSSNETLMKQLFGVSDDSLAFLGFDITSSKLSYESERSTDTPCTAGITSDRITIQITQTQFNDLYAELLKIHLKDEDDHFGFFAQEKDSSCQRLTEKEDAYKCKHDGKVCISATSGKISAGFSVKCTGAPTLTFSTEGATSLSLGSISVSVTLQ